MSEELIEGTILIDIIAVQYWPPPHKERLCRLQPERDRERYVVELFAHSDGHLELQVEQSGRLVAHFESCPMQVPKGNLSIAASWSEKETIMSVNGDTLPPKREVDFHSVTVKEPENNEPAIGHPKAESSCEKWISWRNDKLSIKDSTRENDPRRMKSLAEQSQDLERAISVLETNLELVTEGNTHCLDAVLSTLRALVCWDGNDPLLLRLASIEDLPLPVFADEPINLTEETDIQVTPTRIPAASVTIRRYTSDQTLMDVQEWLNQPGYTESISDREKKNRKIIYDHASTSSLSHYHQHTEKEIDRIRQAQSGQIDNLTRFIYGTGIVTVNLGRYVLGEID